MTEKTEISFKEWNAKFGRKAKKEESIGDNTMSPYPYLGPKKKPRKNSVLSRIDEAEAVYAAAKKAGMNQDTLDMLEERVDAAYDADAAKHNAS